MVKSGKHCSAEQMMDRIPRLGRLRRLARRSTPRGGVTVLGHRGIHRVDKMSGKTTTSIHVYDRYIGHAERPGYDPVAGECRRIIAGYHNANGHTKMFC